MKYILLLFMCILVSSCFKVKDPIIKIYAVSENKSISDSIFFKNVEQIEYANNSLYILDKTHNRIIKSDINFKLINVIGKSGKGPGEFQFPDKFAIHNRNIYVKDKNSFYLFRDETFFKKEGNFNNRVNSKFSVNDSLIFVPTPDSAFTISVFNSDFELVAGFGEKRYISGSAIQLTKHNEKNIFLTHSGNVVTANSCESRIELFTLEGTLLHTLNLNNEIVESRKAYSAKKQKNPLSVVELYSDIYFSNNFIYLLIYDHLNKNIKVSSNKIIEIQIIDNWFVVRNIYALHTTNQKVGFYTSFCVLPDKKLIAYEHLSGTFQTFILNKND